MAYGRDVVELEVKRAVGVVVMKPKHLRRDVGNGGRTSRAAARLATYRLRKFLRDNGRVSVDDIVLSIGESGEDFIRNQRTVYAETACVAI